MLDNEMSCLFLRSRSPSPPFPLSRKETLSLTLSRKREKGQTRKAILNPRRGVQAVRFARFTFNRYFAAPLLCR